MRILLQIPFSILVFYLFWLGLKSVESKDQKIPQSNSATTIPHISHSTTIERSNDLTIQHLNFICDRRSDSLELVKFYNATGGPNWWKKWDLKKPMSTWWGISINGAGCIDALNLGDTLNLGCCSGNNLSGNLFDINLPELTYLNLFNNKLIGKIPNFTFLTSLVKLDLAANPGGNQFTGSIPDFTNLNNLNFLQLGNSALTGFIPNFNNLPNLQYLRIYSTSLTGPIPNFDKLPKLQQLNLYQVGLTGSIPNFDKLPKLQFLGISNNSQLTGSIPNFDRLPNLQALNISNNNQLKDSIPNFDNFPILQSLVLSDNQLTGFIPNFNKLPNLNELVLSGNQISGVIPNFIQTPKLQFLWLNFNQLTGSFPDNTLTNPKLDHYLVENNKLTFSGLIKNLFKVKELTDITNRHCTGCIDTLIYAPQQKIYTDTTITISPTTNYSIDLKIDDTVTTSTYAWYKNGIIYKTIKGSNKLPFTPFTSNDAGTYTVKITNPLAPQLTLESWPIRLVASPVFVCDRRSDSLELVKFYNATGGPNWTTKWDLKKPMNTWFGIQLATDGCVNRILLNSSNLSGTLISLNLPNLVYLNLGGNQLKGIIPNFDKIPMLTELYLNDNRLTGVIPNFDKIPKLERLILHVNQLSDTIPNFSNFPILYGIRLNENLLTGKIPNFDKLPELISLNLAGNQLSGDIPNFDKIPKLDYLGFCCNLLSGQLPNFNKLPNLSFLDVSRNKITGTIPIFDQLPNLKSLYLHQNEFKGLVPLYTSRLKSLGNLAYQNNKLTFSDLIPNNGSNKILVDKNINPGDYDSLTYAPQQNIYVDTTITISPSTNCTLDLLIDDTVTASTYTWYKNGILDTIIKGKNKLPLTPFTTNDAGTYTVKITNPLAPQLTLETWPIRLVASNRCLESSTGNVHVNKGNPHKSTDIKYLCFNDRLNITVDGITKNKDPNPSTIPGIGYIFYDCKPNIDGPDLKTLLTDPCLNKKTILINGNPVAPANGMWIAKSPNWANTEFNNDGYLQNTYNNGKPVQFWFAAVTLDNIVSDTIFEKNANGVAGDCIAVNTSEAFSVVYLNEVKISNVTGKNNGLSNYTGTFTVTGGLPEWDPIAKYTKVTIVNIGDPNKIGTLTNGPATNGKPMTFSVPTPGKYTITIEDVNGCSVTTNALTIEENPGLIKVICADGKIGDEICYTINIGQVPDLTSVQFTVSFSPQVLQFTKAKNINPLLGTPIDQVIITNEIDKGFIKFFWFDFNLVARDFTKEVPLVQLCFKIKGPPGTTPFRIVPNPGGNLPNLELSNLDGSSIPVTAATGSVLACNSTIFPVSDLDALYTQCGTTFFGQIFGGKEGYKLKYRLLPNAAFKDSLYINQVSKLTSIFANQTSGKYELVVTDTVNAQIKDTFDYDANLNPLVIDLSSRDNPSCKGNDGRITAMVNANVKSPKYLWSNGNITPTINQLSPGKYTVTVTDISGCSAKDSITLITTKVKSAIIIQNKASCRGVFDGSAIPDFANIVGLAPFTTKWIGPGVVIGNRFSGLGKGPFGLVVTDKQGCSDTAFVDVSSTREIVANVTVDNLQCFGTNDGRITISNRRFNNGDPLVNDSVLITNPSGNVSYFPLNPVRYNPLGVGKYGIYIKDQTGCVFRDSAIITQPNKLDTSRVIVKAESCFPGNDGSLQIDMKGGTLPYKYNWTGFSTDTNRRVNITQGNYSVNISDKNGCKLSVNNLLVPFGTVARISKFLLAPDFQIVKSNTPTLFDILLNDSITNNTLLNIMIDNPPNGSIIYSQTTGKGTYTPRRGFSGKETLTYTVCPIACLSAPCKSSTIEFTVDAPCSDKTNLSLPNIIYPEGTLNRYFVVEALNKCPEAFGPKPTKLTVYNRWGDVVYYSDNYLNRWDGVNNQGQPLPGGTYFYLLDLGSVSAPVKGYVVIMR